MSQLIIAAVVCFIISASTCATDQHLICKPVEDAFSSDEQIQSDRLQGPPARNCRQRKSGPKGDRGDRGRDGIVDYSSVNDTVEEAVAIATAKLQAKVEKLENDIRNITDMFSRLDLSALQAKVTTIETDTTIETTTSMTTTSRPLYLGDCTDGIIFGVKCYFVEVQLTRSRLHGDQICRKRIGRIANLVSLEHQTLVMDYIRGEIPDDWQYVHIYMWTALVYEKSTETIRLSDGRSLSASTLGWHPRYPSRGYTGIKLEVYLDASRTNQGLYNTIETGEAQGVLCEK